MVVVRRQKVKQRSQKSFGFALDLSAETSHDHDRMNGFYVISA